MELRDSIAKSGIVKDDFWFIGRRLPRILYNVIGGDSALGANNLAQGVYISTSYKDMVESCQNLPKRLNFENPDLKIIVDKFDSGPPVEAAVEYSIDGPDIDILRALGKEIRINCERCSRTYF